MEAVVAMCAPCPGETLLDCTAGLGGHAAALGASLGPLGQAVLNDLDSANLIQAERAVAGTGCRVHTLQGNFAEAPRRLCSPPSAGLGLAADMVLADLGFASTQVDDSARGFSFMREGPLDMRMDPSRGVTAADLVASLPESELARLIHEYGEDRHARRIAGKIVQERARTPITTTLQLAAVARAALGPAADRESIHPATRTFQALRIAVNDELGSLESLLHAIARGVRLANQPGVSGAWLRAGARVAIISFHSLEDRLVKRAFADLESAGLVESLSAKPVVATDDEIACNPRARSAKLRGIRVVSIGTRAPRPVGG
jgi:16S rRNA (cytosine1402-N4)-methyltransferase